MARTKQSQRRDGKGLRKQPNYQVVASIEKANASEETNDSEKDDITETETEEDNGINFTGRTAVPLTQGTFTNGTPGCKF